MAIAMTLAMVYAISWIVSTPEGRAAAKPWADKWGGRALMAAGLTIAGLWAISLASH